MSQTLDNVNAHDGAIRANERTRQQRRLQGVIHPAPEVTTGEPWWKRYFTWEPLTVAGRTIEKGWVIPQPLGIALILVMISTTSVLYWRVIDRQAEQGREQTTANQQLREMLIRLDQRLIDKADHDNERFQKIESDFQSMTAWQQVTNKDLARLLPKK